MSRKSTDLTLKYKTVEERYAVGEIDRGIYAEYSNKYGSKISQLEREIGVMDENSSNLNLCIKNAIDLSTNLKQAWNSGGVDVKKRIQNIIFPRGMGYDKSKDIVQTPYVNCVFVSMSLLGSLLRRKEENGGNIFYTFPPLVTPTGFKPVTARAEI